MISERRPATLDTARLSEVLARPERLPETRASLAIRSFFDSLSRWLAWCWLLLMLVIVLNVTMRYLFGEGRIEFEEIQWHLYAVGFLLGMSTCMSTNDHVRVDVFHERLSLRMQAWIELYGLLLLLFPFVLLLLAFSLPFVAYSFSTAEISDAPGGLPLRWIVKSVIPLSMLLLLLASLRRLLRVTSCLFGSPVAVSRTPDVD